MLTLSRICAIALPVLFGACSEPIFHRLPDIDPPNVDGRPPPVPTDFTATSGEKSVALQWLGSSSASRYQIYWSLSAGVSQSENPPLIASGMEYVHSDLQAGTTYYYIVTAENSVGESVPSEEMSATPTTCEPNAKITSLTAEWQTLSSAHLQWESPATDAAQLVVHRRVAGTPWPSDPLITLLPETLEYLDHGPFTVDTTYEYRVVAEKDCLSTEPLESVQLDSTPLPPTSQGPVQWTPAGATLIWNDSNITRTGFQIERRSNNGGEVGDFDVLELHWLPPSGPPFTYGDATAWIGVDYDYRVSARNRHQISTALLMPGNRGQPTANWLGEPVFDTTCHVVQWGTIAYEGSANFHSASGELESANESSVVASEDGVRAAWAMVSPGTYLLNWLVTDNRGGQDSLQRSLVVEDVGWAPRGVGQWRSDKNGTPRQEGLQAYTTFDDSCTACDGANAAIFLDTSSCVLDSMGVPRCWGPHAAGLGQGFADSSTPTYNVCESGAAPSCAPFIGGSRLAVFTPPTGALFRSACLQRDDQVWCWGLADKGQLGDGQGASATCWPQPVCASGSHIDSTCVPQTGIAQLGQAFGAHRCAVTSTNQVICWGTSARSQAGIAAFDGVHNPFNVSSAQGLGAVSAVVTGGEHSCALMATGQVKCWGFNLYSQLGEGYQLTESTAVPQDVCANGAVPCAPLEQVIHLASGASHNCVIVAPQGDAKGDVYCWGLNYTGQAGPLTGTTCHSSYDCVRFAQHIDLGGLKASQLALGDHHSCAVVDDDGSNKVYCWGRNLNGKLGRGTVANGSDIFSAGPVCSSGSADTCVELSGVVSLFAGELHTCAIMANDDLLCWGSNDPAYLDFGSSESVLVHPTLVATDVADAALSKDLLCMTSTFGETKCWGKDGHAVGSGYYCSTAPAPVCALGTQERCPEDGPFLTDVRSMSAPGAHTCAVQADGTAVCWGASSEGALGTFTGGDAWAPVPVCASGTGPDCPRLGDVVAVSRGIGFSCAVQGDGGVRCWGTESLGQLGNGGATNENLPWPTSVVVEGGAPLAGVKALGSASAYTCVVAEYGGLSGVVLCWGANGSGRLGNGTTAMHAAAASPVCRTGSDTECEPFDAVVQVAVGSNHSCAVDAAGAAWCWGSRSHYRLGNGSNLYSANNPIAVCLTGSDACSVALTNVAAVAVGETFSCALLAGGEVRCWGDNQHRQLGSNSSATSHVVPQFVCIPGLDDGVSCQTAPALRLANVVALAAAGSRACAVLSSGELFCWGRFDGHYLGTGAVSQEVVPAPVCATAACESTFENSAVASCEAFAVSSAP